MLCLEGRRVVFDGVPIAQALFRGASGLLSFGLLTGEHMVEIVNALGLTIKANGFADTRTLSIPVAPTIFVEASLETRKAMGNFRWHAVGEDIDDPIADLSRAR
jgi:O-acetylhomoserine (thiol)-lyase